MSGLSGKAQERLLYLISPIGLLVVWQILLMLGFGDRRFIPAPTDIAVRFWSLLVSGAFDRLSAVLVGDFDDCGPSRGVSVEAVLRERLSTLRIPVLAGLRFGHDRFNEPLVFGLPATVSGDSGELVLGA